MADDMPRITAVSAESDTAIRVVWKDGGEDLIELAKWIAQGSPILEPLKDPAVFRQPKLASYGAAVAWGDPDGDLAIDTLHLRLLAGGQAVAPV